MQKIGIKALLVMLFLIVLITLQLLVPSVIPALEHRGHKRTCAACHP